MYRNYCLLMRYHIIDAVPHDAADVASTTGLIPERTYKSPRCTTCTGPRVLLTFFMLSGGRIGGAPCDTCNTRTSVPHWTGPADLAWARFLWGLRIVQYRSDRSAMANSSLEGLYCIEYSIIPTDLKTYCQEQHRLLLSSRISSVEH